MAEEENTEETIRPEFPTGRVKKIMKLDKDINKVTSDALFLISRSTELFLRLLAEKSGQVATEKKRRNIKIDHIITAVKRHRPTSDFLLDSLPAQTESSDKQVAEKSRHRHVSDKPAPPGTRRIDHIFAKSAANEPPIQINDS